MFTGGGIRNVTADNYTLTNTNTGGAIPILSRVYNAADYSLTVTFDNLDLAYRPSTRYSIGISKQVSNACGNQGTNNINSYFSTGPVSPIPTVPAGSIEQHSSSFNLIRVLIDFFRKVSGISLSVSYATDQ
jgi:hypothetical protein